MNWKTAGRWLAILAATLVAAIIANALAWGLLPAQPYTSGLDAIGACTVLGGLAGFWFAYTGRLARLFRRV